MVDPQSQPAGARPDLFSDDPPGSAAAEGSTSDIIVFYCPSGHKLNAPARLQGKAGQWRDLLSDEQAATIEENHQHTMRRHGYEPAMVTT